MRILGIGLALLAFIGIAAALITRAPVVEDAIFARAILANVGRDSVVGAGAVVTQAIPESVIAVGIPARVLRPRFSDIR